MTTPSNVNRKLSIGALALFGATMLTSAAYAANVTLKSADGTVNLVGEYVDYEDDNYIIRTALGDLRISAARVRCEGEACPDLSSSAAMAGVTIAGSDTIGLGMMPLLMTGFAASLDADAELTNTAAGETLATLIGDGGFGEEIGSYLVSATSTEDAFNALLEGQAQVGMASRRILPAEARALRANGAGNMVSPTQERVIAVDSVVVITNQANPVDDISMEQLRAIYAGQIHNWRQLGGPDMPIQVVNYNAKSASRTFFEQRIFGKNGSKEMAAFTVATDDQEMAAMVNAGEGTIGYVGFAFQRGAKPLNLVNECGIPTAPDAFSAKTEEYALDRRMYLYNRGDALDDATQAFLDFAVSAEADGVVAKSGFIDLGIARRSMEASDPRAVGLANTTDAFEAGVAREMLAAMVEHDRLSTTFRFRTGSSRMDEKAKFDMHRLIDYLENTPPGTEITFVGFTDDVGAFQANRRLSFGRARQVLADVQATAQGRLDHITMQVAGFGEVAPSACNVSQRGRAINRRVEVWMAKNG